MFVELFLVIIALLAWIHIYYYWGERSRALNKLPGPRKWPVIGNATLFLTDECGVFEQMRILANTYKTNYRVDVLDDKVFNILEPDDIEIMLTNQRNVTKSTVYQFVEPWLGQGLLLSTGEKWQRRRKILTNAFHFNILRQFCKIFTEHSKSLVNSIKSELDQPETHIQPLVTKAALNMICETAMGTNLEVIKDKSTSYVAGVYKMGVHFVYRVTRVWLHNYTIFKLSKMGREYVRIVDELHKFTMNVIEERRNERIKTGTKFEPENDDENKPKKKLAMLDLLLNVEERGEIDTAGIREEVDTFMFEGHDTTTVALGYCLFALANHPEIQETAFLEVNGILGDSDTAPTIEQFNEMNYLERCIKETLRLYPSVPIVGRLISETLQLKNCKMPPGSLCNIHIFDVHRSEKFYPEPTKFDPDRFLLENCVNRHPFAYIPFSAGPRNCIGQKFAILEMKSVVSAILMKYKMDPITRTEDIKFRSDIVLRSNIPIKIKFSARS